MLALIFAIVSLFNGNEKELQVAEDLKAQWKVLIDGKFQNYDQGSETIYISIDLAKTESGFLQIHSKKKFYVFINSALALRGNHFRLNTDSLKRNHGKSILLSIYQDKGIENLTTHFVQFKGVDRFANPVRPDNSFSNFLIVTTILMVVFFTALLHTNPQLTLDYMNVTKLFSLKRRDETQFTLRITSSVNLIFYFFCGLLTSLAILVASKFSEEGMSFLDTNQFSTAKYLGRWVLLSLTIGFILMIKLGVVTLAARLFGFRDVSGFQFFNFVRALVVSLITLGGASIFCFSFGIGVNYYFLVKCFCIMLALGTFLIYFKLLTRESAPPFHLFSYLCATEIFPLMILIKVLLF